MSMASSTSESSIVAPGGNVTRQGNSIWVFAIVGGLVLAIYYFWKGKK